MSPVYRGSTRDGNPRYASTQPQVRRHYRNGLSDFEMKPKINETLLSAYRDWSSLGESLGPLVSAAYQEIEAEEF